MTGIDFGLVRAPSATVSGRFVNMKDEPTGGSLQLLPSQRSLSAMGVPAGARIYPDGRFEFPNVSPGEYVIQGYRGRYEQLDRGRVRRRPRHGDGCDVAGVIVRTSLGSSIRGRIVFEPASGRACRIPGTWRCLRFRSTSTCRPRAISPRPNIEPDGSFAIEGISGPRRLEVISAPPGWALKEIRAGGINVTDQVLPFGTADESLRDVEVVLTDRVSELIGSVRDDRARPMPLPR